MAIPSRKAVWSGWVISSLASALFLFSALMKLKGGPDLEQGMAQMQLPMSMITALAILELSCAVVYLIPPTAVLGAVLLTGYIGGAMLTHWRVGDMFVVHILLGLFVWLGIYLREPRLKAVLPIRTPLAP